MPIQAAVSYIQLQDHQGDKRCSSSTGCPVLAGRDMLWCSTTLELTPGVCLKLLKVFRKALSETRCLHNTAVKACLCRAGLHTPAVFMSAFCRYISQIGFVWALQDCPEGHGQWVGLNDAAAKQELPVAPTAAASGSREHLPLQPSRGTT